MSAAATHRLPTQAGRRRWLLRVLAVVAAVLAVGVVAAFGGFDEVVPPGDTVAIEVGEQFNAGPWLVTVESAEIGYNLRGHNGLGDDRTLILQVNARVENIDNRSRGVYGLTPILELKDGPKQSETAFSRSYSAVYSLRDNARLDALQPGLPERVAFVWELAPDAQIPDEVTVVVNSLVRRYESWQFTGTATEVTTESLAAAVTVPLVDRTAAT